MATQLATGKSRRKLKQRNRIFFVVILSELSALSSAVDRPSTRDATAKVAGIMEGWSTANIEHGQILKEFCTYFDPLFYTLTCAH